MWSALTRLGVGYASSRGVEHVDHQLVRPAAHAHAMEADEVRDAAVGARQDVPARTQLARRVLLRGTSPSCRLTPNPSPGWSAWSPTRVKYLAGTLATPSGSGIGRRSGRESLSLINLTSSWLRISRAVTSAPSDGGSGGVAARACALGWTRGDSYQITPSYSVLRLFRLLSEYFLVMCSLVISELTSDGSRWRILAQ
jgi:hypothetical protein